MTFLSWHKYVTLIVLLVLASGGEVGAGPSISCSSETFKRSDHSNVPKMDPKNREVWIRAFIPKDLDFAQKGDNGVDYFKNPWVKSYSATDQRLFSTNPLSKSRITVRLVFEPEEHVLKSYEVWSNCTYHVSSTSGKVEDAKRSSPNSRVFQQKNGDVFFYVSGSHPLLKTAVLAPVSFTGFVRPSGNGKGFAISLQLNIFPAHEIIVYEAGKAHSVLEVMPEKRANVWDLFRLFFGGVRIRKTQYPLY